MTSLEDFKKMIGYNLDEENLIGIAKGDLSLIIIGDKTNGKRIEFLFKDEKLDSGHRILDKIFVINDSNQNIINQLISMDKFQEENNLPIPKGEECLLIEDCKTTILGIIGFIQHQFKFGHIVGVARVQETQFSKN